MNEQEKWMDYLEQLRRPFIKLARLRFLQPDGSTAFAVDSNEQNPLSKTFIADGEIQVNLQNGQRRGFSATLDNVDEQFSYNVNRVWFGSEIALDEGLILSDGSDYYIQQGIFLANEPVEDIEPGRHTMSFNMVDKWANLDGTLSGNLEGTYEVAVGTFIFDPIVALLSEDRGNGLPVDVTTPIFTDYYNDLTQQLPDGTSVAITDSPYTLRIEGGSTKADVILGLAGMVNAWVGYDSSGALRIDASQDDIIDADKPVLWRFSQDEAQLLGLSYSINNSEVYNDYIVIGQMLDDNSQPGARAQNWDAASDTNIGQIGYKTYHDSGNNFATVQQCSDYAEWMLKRVTVLKKTVSVRCSQLMHLRENELIELIRSDKEGSPIERHLIQGFSRPLVGTEPMTINCISTADFPTATITEWPPKAEG